MDAPFEKNAMKILNSSSNQKTISEEHTKILRLEEFKLENLPQLIQFISQRNQYIRMRSELGKLSDDSIEYINKQIKLILGL